MLHIIFVSEYSLTTMATLKIEDISDRQLQIISAAGKLLARSGVAGLTIKNLAAEMRFTEGAIYRHFTSKDQIILSMLDYLMKNINERLQPIARGQGTAMEKLSALINSQTQFFKKNPHFVVAVFPDGLMEETGAINQSISQIVGTKSLYVRLILEQGQREGAFKVDIPIEDLTHITMGTFRMLMFKWRINQFKFDLEEASIQIFDSLFKIISSESNIGK
jgi:AcrR family transcriptional regulator